MAFEISVAIFWTDRLVIRAEKFLEQLGIQSDVRKLILNPLDALLQLLVCPEI
jgi:hypothetical protein